MLQIHQVPPKAIRQNVIPELIDALIESGMTQMEIAAKLKVSKSTITRWRQELSTPTLWNAEDLIALAEKRVAKMEHNVR